MKALQRIMGTLVGLGCGLAITYFTYLCNGLSYDNEPAKVWASGGREGV